MWPARLSAKQQQGQLGEQQALAYLQQQGLSLVETNFNCKAGEIDLIMRERDTLVFVEVRKRDGAYRGAAADSITPAKKRRVIRAAQLYLSRFPRMPACRIDIVTIDGGALEWLPNAIEV
jgi:putative endonuclease